MGRYKTATPQIRTSVLVSPEFYRLCHTHGVSFSEALRTGIAIILAEKGVCEYDNRLNIVRLVGEYKKKAAEYAQKAADLETKQN